MEITYGSVCSGIEAATLAWKPLGMRAAWFAEIEAFPSAVLAHHYPNTPNLGDMTKLGALVLAGKIAAPDVLVGGTPCQAFSVAGMRQGLLDPRGALTIKYVELADATDYVRAGQRKPACVVVWENVPGVLSDKGNAFGCFLGALAGEDCELQPSGKKWPNAGCVYGPKRTIAWRVLDAQYFGLAQRRRRVFVVASARDGFDPTEVLFEREGLRRDTAPRRGQGQDVTGTAPFGPALQCGCGEVFAEELGPYGCVNCEGDEGPAVSMFGGIPAFGGHSLVGSIEQAATLTAKDTRMDMESETFFVAPTLAEGARKSGGYSYDDVPCVAATLDASYGRLQGCSGQDANHGHSHLVVHGTQDPCISIEQAHTLGRNNGQENAVLAFTQNSRSEVRYIGTDGQVVGTLAAEAGAQQQNYIHCRDVAQTITSNYGKQLDNTNSALGPNIVAELSPTLRSGNMRNNSNPVTEADMLVGGPAVRRLTPRECERLQGQPDDYTLIPWRGKPAAECPDGPRYKAIGNSKAVTVVRWIGQRILKQITASPYG
ncbi:DNA (cytosine-5-)-methyltransferase [Pseudomonas vancouverensis]|uniref:DNA (cytosine-5-)-methyltransferase n=1 Tax=Pseudomonas vancouverensis TaxID=95300 RepID=A0A1H2MVK7_PSEVA|nr:DNA (cytosine-5-)-methyltransferase [Pseudomonas vancouverensis]KAB0489734.1 DNA (cytosine-5-)-methyltransferase [Pseudomonas vancouverensis]TDB67229.1 DNA (cytosine-5-)-methyltransferase [Pseudomonas vancouverensis]SDU96596.1 DNA (cytosine-5)-methyltransferase 1 [Pseudomonas vancouverensis]